MKAKRFNNDLYVKTSPLQSFMLRTDSHIILVNFISDCDISMYDLGQKIIRQKMKGVGTLIENGIQTFMEHEQENAIQKNKTR
jgi:hypothetical protein